MVKIGDKVRFLSEVGGGIVKGFRGKDTALVEDAEGFEIPMLVKECVVIETNEYNFAQKAESKENTTAKKEIEPKAEEIIFKKNIAEEKGRDVLNIHLAFVPQDIKKFATTDFDIYLVNDSNYYAYYTLSRCETDRYICEHHGVMEPNSKIFIESINKNQLGEYGKIAVQLIAFKHEKHSELKPAVSNEMKIDGVKFYKLHSFKENPFFNAPAIIYDVVKNDSSQTSYKIDEEALRNSLMKKDTDGQNANRQANIKADSKTKNIVEVDLHIEELLETTAGMDNKSMLEYQLKVVEETIEKNIKRKGQKIVFIHGKGEGVLRKAIISLIKQKYRNFTYQDASFQEYGFGATMVTVR